MTLRLAPMVIASAAVGVGLAIAPVAAAASDTIPGEGVFRVGVDIQPGTYASSGSSGSPCIWYTLRDPGDPTSVITDGSSEGQIYATIHPTDRGFETQNCQTWHRVS